MHLFRWIILNNLPKLVNKNMGDVIKVDFGGDKKDDNNAKDNPSKRDLIKEGIASVAKEFPVPEIGRQKKITEALLYISLHSKESLSILRLDPKYEDNIFVFKEIVSHGEVENILRLLEGSSETNWGNDPVYYLALLDTLIEVFHKDV